jgi:hypothetical protein
MSFEINKQTLETNVNQWVQLDNQIKEINERVKQMREKRNTLETTITTYVASNNLSNSTMQISNGKLKFANTKVLEPITLKYLEKTLCEVIKNKNQVDLIIDHIKQKREIKMVPEIKRFYTN